MMRDSYFIELMLVFLLAVLVGLLRAGEVSIAAVLKTRMKERAEGGDARAACALRLAENPEGMLTALHIVAVFALILLGAYAGSTLAVRLAENISSFLFPGEYSCVAGYIVTFILLSFFVILTGEIIPKRLAVTFPETVSRTLAPGMLRMTLLLSPIAKGLEAISKLVFRLFGISCETTDAVTEEEVKEMIREGTDLGVFEQAEERMVNKVLKLGDKTAAALMTPRNDIVWLDTNRELPELLNVAYESGHSNFVVARETLDTVLGIVSIGDLSQFALSGHKTPELSSILREPLLIPDNLSALKVLEQMREAKRHIALVVDEYGGLDGLVTTHDLIEAVVGEIADEDEEEVSIVERSDNSCLIDAAMDVDEVLERFNMTALREEEKRGYHSLGGFILSQLGHIPLAGEAFEYEGHRFEVVDMDKNRIDKVLIRKLPGATAGE